MSLQSTPSTRERGQTDGEDQIQHCLARWKQAMERKDAAATVACYAEDAVLFTLAPPLCERGMNPQALQAWFDTWKTGPRHEMRDVRLVVSEDIAYCHCLTHMTGSKTSGEAVDLWFRATVGLRKVQGEWKLVHEHTSVPFKMDGSYQAAVDLKPG